MTFGHHAQRLFAPTMYQVVFTCDEPASYHIQNRTLACPILAPFFRLLNSHYYFCSFFSGLLSLQLQHNQSLFSQQQHLSLSIHLFAMMGFQRKLLLVLSVFHFAQADTKFSVGSSGVSCQNGYLSVDSFSIDCGGSYCTFGSDVSVSSSGTHQLCFLDLKRVVEYSNSACCHNIALWS
jgi:hypothetical protein